MISSRSDRVKFNVEIGRFYSLDELFYVLFREFFADNSSSLTLETRIPNSCSPDYVLSPHTPHTFFRDVYTTFGLERTGYGGCI